ncbi:hypothetical protein GGF46_000687 [Coemansia sp. RSA 552]|nr:hypothetical protein GGF46_000687 [Coemansia sp. RSA 552]
MLLIRIRGQAAQLPARGPGLAWYTTRSGHNKPLGLQQGRHETSISPGTAARLEITHRHHHPPPKASVAGTSPPRVKLAQRIRHTATSVTRAFLPTDYKTSVTPEYIGYTKWQFFHNVLGSASGVLSTQAMLYAMGLGVGSLPLSAAINWVIKDGFGQLGGVVYATMVGQKFDSDPKHQRFWSAVWLQSATWLEMMTPLFPHMFLLVGSVANIGKNISWLAMSATKASINKTFCLKENLGDLTAKHGSQATAAGLMGTALGVLIGATMDVSINTLIVGFVPISLASLWGNYKSLLYTITPTLNVARAHHMLGDAIEVRNGELRLDPLRLKTPKQVSDVERFMHQTHHIEAHKSYPRIAISPDIHRLTSRFGLARPATNPDSSKVAAMIAEAFQVRDPALAEKYYIGTLASPAAAGGSTIYLWFDKKAESSDILLGFYEALALRKLLGTAAGISIDAARTQAHLFARQTFAATRKSVTENGWDMSIMYFAKQSSLVEVKH